MPIDLLLLYARTVVPAALAESGQGSGAGTPMVGPGFLGRVLRPRLHGFDGDASTGGLPATYRCGIVGVPGARRAP